MMITKYNKNCAFSQINIVYIMMIKKYNKNQKYLKYEILYFIRFIPIT